MFSQSSLQTTPADLVAAELRATGYADAAGSPLLELGAASVASSFSGSIGDARLFNAGYDELRAYFEQFAQHYADMFRTRSRLEALRRGVLYTGGQIFEVSRVSTISFAQPQEAVSPSVPYANEALADIVLAPAPLLRVVYISRVSSSFSLPLRRADRATPFSPFAGFFPAVFPSVASAGSTAPLSFTSVSPVVSHSGPVSRVRYSFTCSGIASRLSASGYSCFEPSSDVFKSSFATLASVVAAAAARLGAPIPGDSVDSQFSRIIDPGFWSRVYMKRTQRAREFALVKSGFVAKRRELYVSDASLKLFRETKARQAAYLENQYIVDRRLNEKGEHSRFSLAAAAASAAESRAAERWAFIKGIEQLSVEAGLDCALLTLTLEETYHANPTTPGAAYDGVSTPADCRAELSSRWHKIERDLHNRGVALSGARFLEPHGDATPHWHLWVHYDPAQLVLILEVIGRYFPRGIRVRSVDESADGELKSKKNGKRFTQRYAYFDADALAIVPASKFVATRRGRGVDLSIINRNYANGATYAAKYSLKTFTPGEASERVAASRWVWGGRSFQFFGIKRCLTLWRSLYRSSDVPTDPHAAALYRVVHAEPGKHTVHRRDPSTGDVIEFEQEGGTAPFLRLLGGLAAAGRRASTVGYRSLYATFPGRYGDASRRHTGYVLYNEDGEVVHTLNTKEPGRYVRCSVSLDSTVSGAERLRATASKLSAFTATLSSPDLPARRIINPATAAIHFEYMFVGPRQPS